MNHESFAPFRKQCARVTRVCEEVCMKRLQVICPECRKRFGTESGLIWHLFHIHKWKDTKQIMRAPSPSLLAEIAVEEEMLLAAYAKGLGVEVGDLERLIQKHFGKEVE